MKSPFLLETSSPRNGRYPHRQTISKGLTQTVTKIKIMTDSASDIPPAIEQEYGIRILPFPVTVGDDGYLERVDFTPEEFYDILLSAPRIPATSQITFLQFKEEFEAVHDEGFAEMIYVSINSGGSNTYNNAVMARDELYEKHPEWRKEFPIHLVDSKTYCMAYGYPVIEAAKKAARGASSLEILAFLEDWFDSVEIYLAPFTLEFAKKSGRIPCAAAFVGELIGLKPIIAMIGGETKILEKVRGDKAVIPALIKRAAAAAVPHTPYIAVRGMLKPEADELFERAKRAFGAEAVGIYPAGAAIAINAGPKMVALIVKGKNRKIS